MPLSPSTDITNLLWYCKVHVSLFMISPVCVLYKRISQHILYKRISQIGLSLIGFNLQSAPSVLMSFVIWYRIYTSISYVHIGYIIRTYRIYTYDIGYIPASPNLPLLVVFYMSKKILSEINFMMGDGCCLILMEAVFFCCPSILSRP